MPSQVSIPHINDWGEGQGGPTRSAVRQPCPATGRRTEWGRGDGCEGQETAKQTGDEDAKRSDSKTEKEETYLRNCEGERTWLVADCLRL